jgi:hypothetical protein
MRVGPRTFSWTARESPFAVADFLTSTACAVRSLSPLEAAGPSFWAASPLANCLCVCPNLL